MIIPKKVVVVGRTIDTVFDKTLDCVHGNMGEALFSQDQILLQTVSECTKRSKQNLCIDYLHELIHHILTILGYNRLSGNEDFVNRLSEVLFQVIPQLESKGKYCGEDILESGDGGTNGERYSHRSSRNSKPVPGRSFPKKNSR